MEFSKNYIQFSEKWCGRTFIIIVKVFRTMSNMMKYSNGAESTICQTRYWSEFGLSGIKRCIGFLMIAMWRQSRWKILQFNYQYLNQLLRRCSLGSGRTTILARTDDPYWIVRISMALNGPLRRSRKHFGKGWWSVKWGRTWFLSSSQSPCSFSFSSWNVRMMRATKILMKKNEKITTNKMKYKATSIWLFTMGPRSTSVASIAACITLELRNTVWIFTKDRKNRNFIFTYAGHPSPVDEANNVPMAYKTLSKCQSCLLHSRALFWKHFTRIKEWFIAIRKGHNHW